MNEQKRTAGESIPSFASFASFVSFFLLIAVGCSSCTGSGNNISDSGPDTDADSDADSDTDSDTDTDTETHTETLVDAGPWEWNDLPDSGDACGDGCFQLSVGNSVESFEWDVWGDFLVYKDYNFRVNVVDIGQRKYLAVPAPIADCVIAGSDGNCFGQYPSVTQGIVYYGLLANSPHRSLLVRANLLQESQTSLYTTIDNGEDTWESIKQIDAYGDRVVTTGGCNDGASFELCFFTPSSPGEVAELDGAHYGGSNGIWGDLAVWFTGDYEGDTFDVEGYNFVTSQTLSITDDTETQLNPRIQGNTVVYMDLRFGDSLFSGNWNHAAIFAYDLVTHETTQVTSGEWIATYPDVYDDIVVWGDYRDCANPNNIGIYSCVEIWGYNLATGTEFKITDLPGRAKQTPRIWGDKVFVDMSKSTGGSAIFMFDLPDGAK